jgi:hypothetical protein
MHGDTRNAYTIPVGKPEGPGSLGRCRIVREDNIKMDLTDIVYERVNWIHLAQDRDQWWDVLKTVMNIRFLRGPFAKFVDSPYYSESELCGGAVTVSFSKYLLWHTMHFLQRSTHF